MRLINQSHEILQFTDPSIIEVAGRTCYKSEKNIGCIIPKEQYVPDHCLDNPDQVSSSESQCTSSCPHHSSNKFIQGLIKRKHMSVLEHGIATVRFVTNRGVTHELVRHRIASFSQESTRYVKYDEVEFIVPVWSSLRIGKYSNLTEADHNTTYKDVAFLEACLSSEKLYRELIDAGDAPERAREVLPNALKTEVVVTANFREWRHMFGLRALGVTGRPHPQIKLLFANLLFEFARKAPAIFGDQGKRMEEIVSSSE